MNKQLNDEDLGMAFRQGLKKLKYFYANYVSINGSCLQLCQSYDLRKLSLHSCSKVSAARVMTRHACTVCPAVLAVQVSMLL